LAVTRSCSVDERAPAMLLCGDFSELCFRKARGFRAGFF